MLENIVIRRFAKDDRQLVVDFFGQMGGETRAFFDRNSYNLKVAMSYFDGDPKDKVFFIAEKDGKMVGYLYLSEMRKAVPSLGIAISEDMKGQKLGRHLMEFAKDYAKARGMGGIMLTTHMANLRGQALYERTGFERLGTHPWGEVLYIYRFDSDFQDTGE